MSEKPRFKHFNPPMRGDKFLYQCGEIDVWETLFMSSNISSSHTYKRIVLRHADNDNAYKTFMSCSNVNALELAAKGDDRYLPLLARVRLTGCYP